ncbi:helix-turn-helix transcriptional regulator [Haloglomus halophilum]|uniref:helix-turn-helix transcriptional regulator n=1 Tax=Haloglomus halophilum TaxID=2962672 RepID=UPI0020C9460E|nr:helix-turn-helix domain-containing protein [Haloglomus halophilum]
MTRPGAIGVVVFLVVASVAPALALPATAGGASAPGGPAVAQVGNQDVDSTEFRIRVYENTSARWTFVYKVNLNNESEREDFRAYADRFNSQETELYTNFKERARSVTAQGTNATGRQMNASGFSKDAQVVALTDNQGIVRMSFRWSNFATRVDGTVEIGDVFTGGFYIGPGQRLVVQHGPNLRFQSAAPQPILDEDSLAASDTLTWVGERSFVDERPQVRLVSPSSPTPTDGPGDPTESTTPTNGSTGFLPILGLGVVLLLGLGAALAYGAGALPGRDDDGGAAADDASGSGGSGGGAAAEAGDAGAAGAGAAGAAGQSPEPAVSDEELLEDDERVMRLLEENGGRMKQVNIVEETGWSKSKVSMLLSDMEDEEQISKLRVGRENIISKKGMEPDAAGSPFDDEE